MNYWLMKSEPSTYSIDSLIHAPQSTDRWEGVRNYQARNFMKDQMKKGDLAFFYHSNCEIPGIVGIMQIVRESYPDPTAWDIRSAYFDSKSTVEHPRWFMVDVQYLEKFNQIIPLTLLKTQKTLEGFVLLRPGNRLSILPVTTKEWQTILKLKG